MAECNYHEIYVCMAISWSSRLISFSLSGLSISYLVWTHCSILYNLYQIFPFSFSLSCQSSLVEALGTAHHQSLEVTNLDYSWLNLWLTKNRTIIKRRPSPWKLSLINAKSYLLLHYYWPAYYYTSWNFAQIHLLMEWHYVDAFLSMLMVFHPNKLFATIQVFTPEKIWSEWFKSMFSISKVNHFEINSSYQMNHRFWIWKCFGFCVPLGFEIFLYRW